MAAETRVAYGETLAELCKENKNIVVLDADLSGSTKSGSMKKVDPERFINAGIAECNMLGMAAGLATSGKTIFASSFAMFATGRPYEIIRNSICYPQLNVKVVATHAGLSVGEDGASHQCIEDISLMRSIPNMNVFCPADQFETKALIKFIAETNGPCYVRLSRGKVEDSYTADDTFDFYKLKTVKKGSKVLFIATGMMVAECKKAAEELKELGIDPTIVDVCCLKPFDEEGLVNIVKDYDYIYTMEEHSVIGGLYSAVSETLTKHCPKKVYPFAVYDIFGESGKGDEVMKKYGLCASNIVAVVKEQVK